MRMFANLDEEMFQIFVSFLISQTVIWGSGCSGSECPSFVMAAFMAACNKLGVDASQQHLFSAESEPKKRDFIKIVTRGGNAFLFSCIFDLTREEATCARHGLVVRGLPMLLSQPFVPEEFS